jgi:subtilisin family serine protease
MNKLLLLISFLAVNCSFSQDTLIVFFKDKANSDYIQVTERSMQRRKKNNVVVDARDKNVSQDYIEEMNTVGRVTNVSRWLNAVTMVSTMSTKDLLANYGYIKSIRVSKSIAPLKKNKFLLEESTAEKAADYGPAQHQIEQINLDCLHDLGFDGDGIFIAVIDAGFRGMDTIPYFDSAFVENRIIDTYDFLSGTPSVYDYSSHGTAVSSCIFAENDGPNPISTAAVEVDVALYVSEDVASETIIEEFYLVSALERADSVGVDIATISLGYTGFDNPADDHPYSDMDGETTIAALGVNAAASKGILVLASAGNSGPNPISTPCDADSCLCVGAMDVNNLYVGFSSKGPSADNQVKPDIIALGQATTLVLDDGSITTGNGTSFSTPLMAGAMACLMQANPQSTIEELKLAIRQSGSTYSNPNDSIGYGIPDMCEANDTLYSLSIVGIEINTSKEVKLYPNPSKGIIVLEGLDTKEGLVFNAINVLGEVVKINNVHIANGQYILEIYDLANGIYTLEIRNNEGTMATKRVIKL